MDVYALKLESVLKERIWGGRKLCTLFGKNLPGGDDVKIGESWELSDLSDDECTVANGSYTGWKFGDLVRKFPVEMAGNALFGEGEYPLLIKLLDAEDVLSVQVHPDEAACQRLGKGRLKTECWYIMEAAPGAVIYKGIKKGVTRQDFAAAIERAEAADMLCEVPVSVGECHYLPAGTVHAIGAGLVIAEVQTPSDTTWRVWDWGRVDAAGKSRPLHVTEAMESINFDISADDLPVTQGCGRLVESPYFAIDKGKLCAESQIQIEGGCTLMFLQGGGQLICDGNQEAIGPGQTCYLPSACKGILKAVDNLQYLMVRV
jgi:mannose-6-phosphate isomerase